MSFYRIIKGVKNLSGSVIIENGTVNTPQDTKDYSELRLNDAYKRGFDEGMAKAREEAELKIAALKDMAIKEATANFKKLLKRILFKLSESNEKNRLKNVDLIIAVIRKIIPYPDRDGQIIKASVEEVLEEFNKEDIINLQFSEKDFTILLETGITKLIEKEFPNISITINKQLLQGDVIVESGNRIIDATIKEKIRNVERIMLSGGEITPETKLFSVMGVVKQMVGNVIEVEGIDCSVGDMCEVFTKDNKKSIKAEVIGYRNGKNLLMPLDEIHGIGPNSKVIDLKEHFVIGVGEEMLGRVFDGIGNPIDNKSIINFKEKRDIYGSNISPFDRDRIKEPIFTGVRAIDTILTCGKGQRIGIFSGSGVGKSSLLGMIARNTSADINVIALIGERGREVREFIEKDLQESGLKRSVVIAATSDKSPLERVHGALIAATIAEYFKDKGLNVMFMMDSVTRYAMALREIGLATGEPPSTKGYTPSVFSKLPKLLERSGNFKGKGSITGFYTVLVEGDDMNEPVADTVRSILDGHIVLSRKLAERNHFPAIDITASISRVMLDIIPEEKARLAASAKEIVSIINEMEDLINIGAYKSGSNPKVDRARAIIDKLNTFLIQRLDETSNPEEAWANLKNILKEEVKK